MNEKTLLKIYENCLMMYKEYLNHADIQLGFDGFVCSVLTLEEEEFSSVCKGCVDYWGVLNGVMICSVMKDRHIKSNPEREYKSHNLCTIISNGVTKEEMEKKDTPTINLENELSMSTLMDEARNIALSALKEALINKTIDLNKRSK
jgi:hypothetical protein